MLQAAAERAKRTLSKVEQASVTVNHAGRKAGRAAVPQRFEALTKDLLTRTRLTSQQVLRQSEPDLEQVDRILLVGVSTHMPMAAAMLKELCGRQPDNSLAVSEVVARGAALHAGHRRVQTAEGKKMLSAEVANSLADGSRSA